MTQHQHVCSESQQSQQAQAARLATRMQREIKLLQSDPPPGVCAWPSNDKLLTLLEAQIEGPEETVYAKGLFELQVQVPERYPFEPPNVRFVTPVYHPNIDSGGRICLDILNLPPKGAWRPSLNIATVLASIGLLLAEPNADDGLMGDISAEYKHNRPSFDQKARLWTQKHAMQMECQIQTLPLKISSPGSSSLSGQVSNERIDHLKQIKETAVESVRGSQNQTNSMKDSCLPVISTKTLSKRLSLAKEPLLQRTIGHSEGTVNDAYTKIYKENINLQPAFCVDMDVKQNIPKPSFPEINSSRCKLHYEVGIGNSSSFSGDTSKEQGKSVLKGVVMAKENLQPMSCNSEKPPKLSIPKLLDGETGMEMTENTKTVTLQNSITGNSNQRISSLPSIHNLQHCELYEQKPERLRKYKLPISGPLQPEGVNKKNMEAINQMETVIVSDSESDEELVEVSRSRLSLSQRTLTRKRKFGSNAR